MIAAAFPDLDGIARIAGQGAYWDYHHIVLHNGLAGLVAAATLAGFSAMRVRAFGVYLLLFHLHLVMDYFGSGPGWDILYGWPFSQWAIGNWSVSWPFYSWQNISLGFLCIAWTVAIARRQRRTPLEAIMPSLDRQLVALARGERRGGSV